MKSLIVFFLFFTFFAFGQTVSPVLQFPEPELDDSAAYLSYSTNFYRDSESNTVQISLYKSIGRVVNLWADAANESISFSVRDSAGNPAKISFDTSLAKISEEGNKRFLQYSLTSKSPDINIGLFLLGSMRIERDFRYQERYKLPLNTKPVFVQTELIDLISNLRRLPEKNQKKHLNALNANSIEELNSRLSPEISYSRSSDRSSVKIEGISFDAKNHLSLEISVDGNLNVMDLSNSIIHIYNKDGNPITFSVKIGTDSQPLTPLDQNEIFNENFLSFYKAEETFIKNNKTGEIGKEKILNLQRLKRQIKSLELISSKEKLMAGLPNFATYFGRDMMMSALMMEPIWKVSMFEYVITAVLKKLDPSGNVSHEEGLGGQATRENASKYNSLLSKYFESKDKNSQDSILNQARIILKNIQKTTENYSMLDDDFQLPVLVGRYLSNNEVSNSRKIDFLQSTISENDSTTILQLIIKNLKYITNKTKNYAADPTVLNLIGFVKNNEGYWQSASWRDSRTGYAFGRFAMDINAIWVPKALESTQIILKFLKKNKLDFGMGDFNSGIHSSILKDYYESPNLLEDAIKKWESAAKYFWTEIEYEDAMKAIEEKLSWLPDEEEKFWRKILNNTNYHGNISFLTLSLDENGEKIKVENTDPATLLFLTDFTKEILKDKIKPDYVITLLKTFILPYPLGLFVEGLGDLVANDTYAPKKIWEAFKNDKYHSPYVVWGREMNLVQIGLCKQILSCYDNEGIMKDDKLMPYAKKLKDILEKIHTAVEESGLQHNELWSYEIRNGKLFPLRYETTSDIQLWNLTNLTVQYLLQKTSKLN